MARSSIDPELRRVSRFLPRGLHPGVVVRVDRATTGLLDRRPPPPGGEVVPVGDVSVRLHGPHHPHHPDGTPVSAQDADGAGLPALLWIHGGGYVVGHPSQDDSLCRLFARRLGIVVAAVAYRRAPEHPFPTPLHDCHDALAWLAARPDVDPSRIAIGGASAGGGLAAALALLARERGEVQPAFQLLTYPMLDDRTVLHPPLDESDLRLWNSRSNRFGWESYLGRPPGFPGVDGLAAPSRHDDLAGLPPAWIGVGTCDLFFDEDLEYARRLTETGVPCEVHVAPGAFHGFDAIRPNAAVARDFRDAQVEALRRGLGLRA